MNKIVKIWDKKSPINEIEASHFINSIRPLSTDEVVLINNKEGITEGIHLARVLRSNYNLSNELTAKEVGEAYLDILEKVNQEQIDTLEVIEALSINDKKQDEQIMDSVELSLEIFEMVAFSTMMQTRGMLSPVILNAYVRLIVAGTRTFDSVPDQAKDQVAQALIEQDFMNDELQAYLDSKEETEEQE